MSETISTVPSPAAPSDSLLGKSIEELTEWVKERGQPAYRGKQLHQWLYEKGARSLSTVTVFPKLWRAQLADYPIGRSITDHRAIAADKTRKYLLRLADGQIIETVGIPTASRLTTCASSQVGCAMACEFCATGKQGFTRNLAPHEIVDQILTVQEDFQRRVSHVVFMGMGEPLLNLPSVIKAIHSLNRDVGISQRAITVSTVGLPHKIRELAEHQLQITLAVSLHASNQALRKQLIPSAAHYTLEALIQDCRDYVTITGRRVTFEYVLLAGVNDRPEHAKELAHLLRGFQAHVNLIPYNPISEADFQRPDPQQIAAFRETLEANRVAVSVRYSRGLDADAACGQLRSSRALVTRSN